MTWRRHGDESSPCRWCACGGVRLVRWWCGVLWGGAVRLATWRRHGDESSPCRWCASGDVVSNWRCGDVAWWCPCCCCCWCGPSHCSVDVEVDVDVLDSFSIIYINKVLFWYKKTYLKLEAARASFSPRCYPQSLPLHVVPRRCCPSSLSLSLLLACRAKLSFVCINCTVDTNKRQLGSENKATTLVKPCGSHEIMWRGPCAATGYISEPFLTVFVPSSSSIWNLIN